MLSDADRQRLAPGNMQVFTSFFAYASMHKESLHPYEYMDCELSASPDGECW